MNDRNNYTIILGEQKHELNSLRNNKGERASKRVSANKFKRCIKNLTSK